MERVGVDFVGPWSGVGVEGDRKETHQGGVTLAVEVVAEGHWLDDESG